MTRIIKYLPKQFNPLLSDCKTIALGTTKQYREAEASLGTTDNLDGSLYVLLKDVHLGNQHYKDSIFNFNDLGSINIFCASHSPCDPKTLDPSYDSSYIIKDAEAFARIITAFIINEFPKEVVSIREMSGKVTYIDNAYLEGRLSYVDLHKAAMFRKREKFQANNEYRIAFFGCLNDKADEFFDAQRILLNCEQFWPSIERLLEPGPLFPK